MTDSYTIISYPIGEYVYGYFYILLETRFLGVLDLTSDLSELEKEYVLCSENNGQANKMMKNQEFSWVDVIDYSEDTTKCGKCVNGYIERHTKNMQLEVLGDLPFDPIISGAQGFTLFSDELHNQLKATNVNNYRTIIPELQYQHPPESGNPRIHLVNYHGNKITLNRIVAGGMTNRCPKCMKIPVVCDCGKIHYKCPNCNTLNVFYDNNTTPPEEASFKLCKSTITNTPVDVRLWDKSDFIAPFYVTRSVIDWLQSVHAYPFVAIPVPFYSDLPTCQLDSIKKQASRPL
ncbi:MAG: hypothetical protein HUJ26_01095 [Planctomycetaceae bacterium]|nr:hypothetical protein [Planctomycetaceae bacterium]